MFFDLPSINKFLLPAQNYCYTTTSGVIGKCSKCGGKVTIPNAWYSTEEPVPMCGSCGAKKKCNFPIIEME